MTAKAIVSGVGVRYADAFILDPETGFPEATLNSGTLQRGVEIEGIKSFDYSDPDPQLFTHYGSDNPFAQDSLPATEVGSFNVTTAKTNKTLDAYVSDLNVVTLDGTIKAIAGNTNKKGFEPQILFNVFRQALDTEQGSATFGKLRQWDLAMIPSTRLVSKMQSQNQGITDKAYKGIPTPVVETPWGETLTDAIWKATQAEYLSLTTDYRPVSCVGLGNGTLTTFGLPVVPIDTAHTHFWVSGTLATVSSVDTTANAPKATLSVAPALNAEIFAIVETNSSL